tara:strand:+ start:123 stop:437 length:315 start_codon:yes stop_codon:yes gene_type:complete
MSKERELNKIEELVIQSGFMKFWFTQSTEDCEKELCKFAELIIKECIYEASMFTSATIHKGFVPENPTREHYEEWAYIEGNNKGYNDAVAQIVAGLSKLIVNQP